MKPKTMTEIRDAEAKKHGDNDWEYGSTAEEDFKTGFDCRDSLDNEALKLAIKGLKDISKGKDYGENLMDRADIVLAEIRKLMGEK